MGKLTIHVHFQVRKLLVIPRLGHVEVPPKFMAPPRGLDATEQILGPFGQDSAEDRSALVSRPWVRADRWVEDGGWEDDVGPTWMNTP